MKIKWKKFMHVGRDGKARLWEHTWSFNEDENLLQRISMMPRGIPISFAKAWNAHNSDIISELDLDGGGLILRSRLKEDWIKWISEQGFQIVLTGDEYEILEKSAA